MDCAPSPPAATGKFPGTLQDRDRDRRTPTTCEVTISPTIPAANRTKPSGLVEQVGEYAEHI